MLTASRCRPRIWAVTGQGRRVCRPRRRLVTLAIETSCDDTAVAVLEKRSIWDDGSQAGAQLHFNEKVTANSTQHRGVHPLVALECHQENLSQLVDRAIARLGEVRRRQNTPAASDVGRSLVDVRRQRTRPGLPDRPADSGLPDFITVTRGPGMRTNLATGLDTAKGLAVAWRIPLIGVHHMQAHALTPRLMHALESSSRLAAPAFPYLSLLVSGGHSLFVQSHSLTSHTVLASTGDIAVGEAIDKVARHILPADALTRSPTTMYGPVLERFAFPKGADDYSYQPPARPGDEMGRRPTRHNWAFTPPLAQSKRGAKRRSMEYSFAGLVTAAQRFVEHAVDENGHVTQQARAPEDVSISERRKMAKEFFRVAFEHLASRIVLGLDSMRESEPTAFARLSTLVVSGGVAANQYLRTLLPAFLESRGYGNINIVYPLPDLCTDNAAMIAWAGMEMFEAGWASDLNIRAVRRWSLDDESEDKGILGIGGWIHASTHQ